MNQEKEGNASETKNRPVYQVRYGNVKAAVWQRHLTHGVMHSVTVSRSYVTKTDDGQDKWHDTDSFGTEDLLSLAKAVDNCHSWIHGLIF